MNNDSRASLDDKHSRTAMFSLVDALEDNLVRRPEGSFVFPSPLEASSGNNCHLAAGSDSPTLCSSTQSDPPMRNGVRAVQAGGSDSSLLTGFIRVEVVELPRAEVTFRPGEARRVELIRQREEEAVAAERRVRVERRNRKEVSKFLREVTTSGGGGVTVCAVYKALDVNEQTPGYDSYVSLFARFQGQNPLDLSVAVTQVIQGFPLTINWILFDFLTTRR